MTNSNIWVADFETEALPYYLKYGHTKTWLTYIENLDTTDGHMGITILDHYNFILEQYKKQKRSQYVYFHNLSFDGTFILYFLHSQNIKFETVINDKKKIYEIKIYPRKSKYFISFRCSYLIFLASVESLPFSTKSTIDYQKIRNYKILDEATEEEKYYIIQDVRTVKRNLKMLVDLHKIKLTGFFKTIGSISFKELKKLTNEDLKKKGLWWELLFPLIPADLDEYMREAYRGGVVYVNPKYKGKLITEPMGSWDIVSSFPSVMRNKRLPCGMPRITEKKPPKNKLYIVRLRVAEATIKEGLHPFIATSRAMRYLDEIYSPTMTETVLTLTSIDYEMFEDFYTGDWEVIDYCVFPKTCKGVFNTYIDKYYTMKNDNKQLVEELRELQAIHVLSTEEQEKLKTAIFNKMWAKLKINSPYGKFGTNPTIRSAIPVFDNGQLKWKNEEEIKEFNNYYLPVACFITAYGRENLVRNIQASADRFVYCDTDSEHLIGTETPASLDIGHELGQWEFEGISYKSKFLKPKQYLKLKKNKSGELEIKRTIASLSRSEHKRVNFENFDYGCTIIGGKKSARNVIGGRIIKELDFTFK